MCVIPVTLQECLIIKSVSRDFWRTKSLTEIEIDVTNIFNRKKPADTIVFIIHNTLYYQIEFEQNKTN